jgi:hypothetical protein
MTGMRRLNNRLGQAFYVPHCDAQVSVTVFVVPGISPACVHWCYSLHALVRFGLSI